MNPEKVVFGFFIILALTLNFGFFVGEIENPDHHHVYELFAVVVGWKSSSKITILIQQIRSILN